MHINTYIKDMSKIKTCINSKGKIKKINLTQTTS